MSGLGCFGILSVPHRLSALPHHDLCRSSTGERGLATILTVRCARNVLLSAQVFTGGNASDGVVDVFTGGGSGVGNSSANASSLAYIAGVRRGGYVTFMSVPGRTYAVRVEGEGNATGEWSPHAL